MLRSMKTSLLAVAAAGAFALKDAPRFLMLSAALLSVVIIAAMFGLLGDIIHPAHQGAWVRALALVTFSANAFLCWRLLARPSPG